VSSFTTHNRVIICKVARTYKLKKRAERQAETRLRIIEAAIGLHNDLGPGRTTVSAIAEKAGVERHTYYRHFPDERDLFDGCTGLYMERNPLPDPTPWREIADPPKRLRRGLNEMYSFYERNEAMLANVIRDSQDHSLTREMFELHVAPRLGAIGEVLAEALPGSRRRDTQAALELALDFNTWRLLFRRSGMTSRQAAELMTKMTSQLGC
jgi:AcrR family transcriptional regulator